MHGAEIKMEEVLRELFAANFSGTEREREREREGIERRRG